MSNIELIDGLKRVALNYDALIIDLWGVIHDGVTLMDGVWTAWIKSGPLVSHTHSYQMLRGEPLP